MKKGRVIPKGLKKNQDLKQLQRFYKWKGSNTWQQKLQKDTELFQKKSKISIIATKQAQEKYHTTWPRQSKRHEWNNCQDKSFK